MFFTWLFYLSSILQMEQGRYMFISLDDIIYYSDYRGNFRIVFKKT